MFANAFQMIPFWIHVLCMGWRGGKDTPLQIAALISGFFLSSGAVCGAGWPFCQGSVHSPGGRLSPSLRHNRGPRSHTWGPGSKLLIARVHRSSSPAPHRKPAPRRARISWGPHTSTAQSFCVAEKRGRIIGRARKRKRVGKHIGCGT